MSRSRRPRSRPNNRTVDKVTMLSWVRVAKPEHWDAGLRRDLTLALIAEGHKEDVVAGMVKAYSGGTIFMPRYRVEVPDSELLAELKDSYGC